jgi:hypothetical protein
MAAWSEAACSGPVTCTGLVRARVSQLSGGQQERLVTVAAQEVVRHGRFYPSATLAPNILILNKLLHKQSRRLAQLGAAA